MSNIEHKDDEPQVWQLSITRHHRGHIVEWVDGPMTDGRIEVVPASRLAGAVVDLDEAIRLLNDARPDYVDPNLRRTWARRRKALIARHPRGQ
jgi:hypothetical protein